MTKDKRGLAALRLHLPEPEAHVHLAVHRPCGGEMLALLEPSQTAVTVSREGAHAEVIRQGERPEVVGFGRVSVGRIPACVDLTQYPQSACLERPLAPRPRQLERSRGGSPRLVEPVSDHKRLGELGLSEGLIDAKSEAFHAGEARADEREPIFYARRERVHPPEV